MVTYFKNKKQSCTKTVIVKKKKKNRVNTTKKQNPKGCAHHCNMAGVTQSLFLLIPSPQAAGYVSPGGCT